MDQQPEDDRTVIRPGTPAPTHAGHAAAPPAPPTPPAPAQLRPAPAVDDATRILPPPAAPPPPPPQRPPPASSDGSGTLAVGTMLGEFELTSVIGVGGFGIVYLAQDHSLDRRVALKEYMPSALAVRLSDASVSVKSERHRETFEAGLKSFVNEARLLAQFDHPSLVKVYRFWEANGTAYMVMPFYEGVTLKDRLREMGAPPDEAWLRALLAPLTEALAVIHAENCFHRDIAPDNIILLAGTGRPLLLDFGAARRVIGDMTQALTVILKPGYAPLEQYAEVPHMKQGPWTDVYALAAVVYFAITGRTPPVSVGRIIGDSYQPLAQTAAGQYSPAFLEAVDHALMVRPDERTPSIQAFRAEMEIDTPGMVTSMPTVALVPPPAPRPPPPTQPAASAPVASAAPSPTAGTAAANRTPMWIGIGAAVLALGGGGVFLSMRQSAPLSPPSPPSTASTPPAAVAAAQPAPAPPAAAPAPAPAPRAAAAFSISGEFDRVVGEQAAGFGVAVSAPKTQLRIGHDRLAFNVTSARDGFVYVLVLGPDGTLVRLIPNVNAKANRIAAGQTLALPPPASPFVASDPPGREDFLVIVSSVPRTHDNLGGSEQDGILSLPVGARLAELAASSPGPNSILAGAPLSCSGEECKAYGAARISIDVVR